MGSVGRLRPRDIPMSKLYRINSYPVGSRWRSIDSAPKDGSSVILCKAIDSDGQPIDWRDDLSTAQVFIQVAAWWGDDWVVYCSMPTEPRIHFEPTHWMPIPDPPAAQQPHAVDLPSAPLRPSA